MKHRFLFLVFLLAFALLGFPAGCTVQPQETAGPGRSVVQSGDEVFAQAYRQGRSNLLVEGEGRIIRILPDDIKGSRHQLLVVELDSGQTLLIAHNIDLAPRVPAPVVGEPVRFRGEYEWNDKGGVVHWTHHDPGGGHPAGFIEYRGKRYF